MRRLAGIALIAAVCVLVASPASASGDDTDGVGSVTQPNGGDPVLFISTDGHRPPDHRGAAGPVLVCQLYDHELIGIVGTIKDAPPATDLVEGEDYLLVCTQDGEVVRIKVIT